MNHFVDGGEDDTSYLRWQVCERRSDIGLSLSNPLQEIKEGEEREVEAVSGFEYLAEEIMGSERRGKEEKEERNLDIVGF